VHFFSVDNFAIQGDIDGSHHKSHQQDNTKTSENQLKNGEFYPIVFLEDHSEKMSEGYTRNDVDHTISYQLTELIVVKRKQSNMAYQKCKDINTHPSI
jgi:hypothetical protein